VANQKEANGMVVVIHVTVCIYRIKEEPRDLVESVLFRCRHSMFLRLHIPFSCFCVFPLSFSFLVKNLANVRGPKGLYAASKGSLVIAKEE
jgi:hypothetical protein